MLVAFGTGPFHNVSIYRQESHRRPLTSFYVSLWPLLVHHAPSIMIGAHASRFERGPSRLTPKWLYSLAIFSDIAFEDNL